MMHLVCVHVAVSLAGSTAEAALESIHEFEDGVFVYENSR
jgi:hypothetical protein